MTEFEINLLGQLQDINDSLIKIAKQLESLSNISNDTGELNNLIADFLWDEDGKRISG